MTGVSVVPASLCDRLFPSGCMWTWVTAALALSSLASTRVSCGPLYHLGVSSLRTEAIPSMCLWHLLHYTAHGRPYFVSGVFLQRGLFLQSVAALNFGCTSWSMA